MKAQRKKVYERVVGRFRRLARKLGKKNWKEVELNGLYFKDAYELELKREEDRLALGKEPSNLKPSRSVEGESSSLDEIGKSGGVVDKGDYFSNPKFDPREIGGLGQIWGREDEPTKEEKMKAIEKEFNAELEAEATKDICPVCRSSVCRCSENGE